MFGRYLPVKNSDSSAPSVWARAAENAHGAVCGGPQLPERVASGMSSSERAPHASKTRKVESTRRIRTDIVTVRRDAAHAGGMLLAGPAVLL